MHIHILGICGTFMGGLALLARAAGHTVTGCDAGVYPPMSTQLQEQGIGLTEGFAPEQIALKPDVFVVGNVVARGNPLMEAILNQNLPYTSGPQWLADHILQGKWVLAVAGTHGKTTTTSMLTWILEEAGMQPGFLIGGVADNFGVSARLGASDFFVIEADEYDTAFFDKRSKFVHYRPRTVILNNLEYDHADIFPDLAAIQTQFHHLVRTVPADGRLIVNAHSPSLQAVLDKGCWSSVEFFSAEKTPISKESLSKEPSSSLADWQAVATVHGFVAQQKIAQAWQAVGEVQWALTGEHNQLNGLAAIAAARHIGIAPALAIAALNKFAGVKRRMEVRGRVNHITVYDDFAHHPTAIATTLAGLRTKLDVESSVNSNANSDNSKPLPKSTRARILAVLEPRSNTMKLGVMKAALPESLQAADLIFGYGAANGKDALGWDLAQALAPLGARAQTFNAVDDVVRAVCQAAQAGDHIVVMSNGSFGGVHQKILDGLTH